MDTKWFREMAYSTMRALQDITLMGNPATVTKAVRRRMEALLPGDWVVEVTAGLYRMSEHGLGRLILRRRESVPGQYEDEEDRPSEEVWYIETPEGALARWTNASFLSLPMGSTHDEKWAQEAAERHGLDSDV